MRVDNSFHAADPGSQLGTQQTGIGSFVSQANYIGMVAFVAVVFAVEGFRGRLKSEWIECVAALACAMLVTYPTWWIVRIP